MSTPRPVTTEHPSPSARAVPAPERWRVLAAAATTTVAALQALASLVATGFAAVYALEAASPRNGSDFAELGIGIGVVGVVVGLLLTALFVALVVGLRRRYAHVRHGFALGQGLLLVGALIAREGWTAVAVAWLVVTVVVCYLGRVENGRAAPSQG